MKKIKGSFAIKSIPEQGDSALNKMGGMKMLFEKDFSGDLKAKSIVSMMGLMNRELNSGGYVALEIVEGVLEGKTGSFVLQHSSLMNRGVPGQSITVVPDSGTLELQGIKGQMTIDILEGQHYYTFEYEL